MVVVASVSTAFVVAAFVAGSVLVVVDVVVVVVDVVELVVEVVT